MMRASSSGAAAFSIARIACLWTRLSEALAGIIVDAIGRKPDKHDFPIDQRGAQPALSRPMSRAEGSTMAVAEPSPLAGVTYFTQQPDEALRMIGIDRWTANTTCTRDLDLDQEALVAALRSGAFLVGALGSERRRTERLAARRARDVVEDDLARLRTPIGLPIGARAPWEIGVATLTEVVAKTRETLPKSQRSGS